MSLKNLRSDIDEIDRKLLRLLGRRFEIVEEIAELKSARDLDIQDDAREREVRRNWSASRGKLDPAFVQKLMRIVLKHSKEIQEKTRRKEKRN